MTDGDPETAVSASLRKIKPIKNQHKHLSFSIFYFIKSQTSDSFVSHFDDHFAYLKTLDFSFNDISNDFVVFLLLFCFVFLFVFCLFFVFWLPLCT